MFIGNIRKTPDLIRAALLRLDASTDVNKLVPNISHERAIQMAFSGMQSTIDHTADLDFKLLLNRTRTPYICSDYPVVKYNQFLESKKWKHGKTGFASLGLQIFIPLNPFIAILFFDSSIYKVGNKRDHYLGLERAADIDQLNMLQVLNCLKNIFFNESATPQYIRHLVSKSSSFRRANEGFSRTGHLLKPGEAPMTSKDKLENMIAISSTDCEIGLQIPGIKLHARGKQTVLGNKIPLRKGPEALLKTDPDLQ